MRNRLFAGAALAAALIGCRKPPAPPEPPPADGAAVLDAPAPSASLMTSPLAGESTAYTNEMQAENLRGQADRLGIRGFRSPSQGPEEDSGPPMTRDEALQRMRAFTQSLAAERHAIDREKEKSVALPSATPGVLSGKEKGAPIEDAPGGAGPKDPETK